MRKSWLNVVCIALHVGVIHAFDHKAVNARAQRQRGFGNHTSNDARANDAENAGIFAG